MADDDRPVQGHSGTDPLDEGPARARSVGGQDPEGGQDPDGGQLGPDGGDGISGLGEGLSGIGGEYPPDDDPVRTFGWNEEGRPAGWRGTAGYAPKRRRSLRSGSFSVVVSLAALALGIVAVLLAAGEGGDTVRYVPVRPPEIIGPAPDLGVAPAPVAPVAAEANTAAPVQPLQAEPGGPPAPAAAAVPAAGAPEATVEPVALEPVVAAARMVEPSVVLLQTSEGQGSGIIYDSSGLILTAAHVVDGALPLQDLFALDEDAPPGAPGLGDFVLPEDLDIRPEDLLPDDFDRRHRGGQEGADSRTATDVPDVIVQLASGLRTGGRVLAADAELDVAVVQIDSSLHFQVAETAPLASVDVGQTAVAVGSPFGMENVVTVGVVSAVNQILGGEGMPPIGMIQTDAPINFGNSGGALADLQGRVIGMNVAIQSTLGGGNIGVGFATPIDVAIWIAEELRTGNEVRFGFLGITGYTPRLGEPGAIVASVTPGGPAEAAGMLVDDRIVSIAGQSVGSMEELSVAVRLQAPGTEVEVEVVRDNLLIRLFVPLGDRGESLATEPEPEP